MPPQTLTWEQLTLGLKFPASSYKLEPGVIACYLRATHDASGAFPPPDDLEKGRFAADAPVPPSAVAAFAIKGMIAAVTLPSGSLHLSQDMEFGRPVPVGETITTQAEVVKRQERAGLRLVTLDLRVTDSKGAAVMSGKALVTVPGPK